MEETARTRNTHNGIVWIKIPYYRFRLFSRNYSINTLQFDTWTFGHVFSFTLHTYVCIINFAVDRYLHKIMTYHYQSVEVSDFLGRVLKKFRPVVHASFGIETREKII